MNGRPQPPAPSSPHVVDIQRRRRSEAFNQRLRIADRFILDRQFDKAWLELAEAAKLEPNHPMLDTFKERLECCQKKDSPAPADSTNDVAATDAPPDPEPAPLPAEAIAAIERRVKEEDEFLAEQERRSWKERERLLQEECDRKLAEARAAAEFALSQEQAKITALEAERKRLQEESESRIREGEQKSAELRAQLDLEIGRLKQELHANMELLGAKVPEAKAECVSLFRRRMGELCPGGVPSAEDENTLAKLQALLELSREERLAAESDLRLKLYAEQVEKSTLSGEMNLGDTGALERLKERFRITPEESKRVEPSILSSLQRHVTKGRILLVDDAPTILSSLA